MSSQISETRLIVLLTMGVIVMGSNSFALSPILSDVASDLTTSPIIVARVISAFGAATALSSLILGGQSDRLGARIVLLAGSTLMVFGLLGSCVAQSWEALALSQAIVGIAVGAMLPAIYASAVSSAPDGKGSQVLGRVLSGWGISLVFGVPFSAFVSEFAGWRTVYGVLAVVAAITFFGFLQLPKKSKNSEIQRTSTLTEALRVSGVIPLLLICFTYMTAFYGIYAFMGVHLRTTLGIGAGQAGLVVLAYGAGFGLASFANSHVDRIGPARIFPIILLSIDVIYLILIPATFAFSSALIAAFIWGLVNHVGVNIIILLLSHRNANARSTLMGLHTAVTYSSVFAGPLFLGFLYDAYDFQTIGAIAAILLVSGAIIAHRISDQIELNA